MTVCSVQTAFWHTTIRVDVRLVAVSVQLLIMDRFRPGSMVVYSAPFASVCHQCVSSHRRCFILWTVVLYPRRSIACPLYLTFVNQEAMNIVLRGSRYVNQANLSAEDSSAQACTRIPRTDGNQRWTPRDKGASCQGPSPACGQAESCQES